jgi:hypothetical protein
MALNLMQSVEPRLCFDAAVAQQQTSTLSHPTATCSHNAVRSSLIEARETFVSHTSWGLKRSRGRQERRWCLSTGWHWSEVPQKVHQHPRLAGRRISPRHDIDAARYAFCSCSAEHRSPWVRHRWRVCEASAECRSTCAALSSVGENSKRLPKHL